MKKVAAAALLTLSAASASAVENRFYLTGAVGRVDPDLGTIESSINDEFSKSSGYSITFGYRLNDFLALEGGRNTLGESKASYQYSYDYSYTDFDDSLTEGAIDESGSRGIASDSIMLGLAISTDIGTNFTGGFRFGLHQWCMERTVRGIRTGSINRYDGYGNPIETNDINDTFNYKAKETDNDPYYGVALGWSIKEWAVSLEHTIYEIEDRKPSLSALALTYSF